MKFNTPQGRMFSALKRKPSAGKLKPIFSPTEKKVLGLFTPPLVEKPFIYISLYLIL